MFEQCVWHQDGDQTAIAAGVENFTLISTDKAVRPTNFMGASKRLAELICQANAASQNSTNIAIVRFGNVMWSSGSVLPRFEEQIMSMVVLLPSHILKSRVIS